MEDQDLMLMFQTKGDQIAFERLYHKYKLALLSFAYAHVRNQQSAEEIVHETFLKVHRFKEKFDATKSFKTWLWTICKNTCLDFLRSNYHFKNQNFDDLSNELSNELNDKDNEILNLLIEKSNQAQIHDCIDKLALDQKHAILLWMNDELSFHEIGEILNRTEGAAKNLVQRAKANLKKFLGEINETN